MMTTFPSMFMLIMLTPTCYDLRSETRPLVAVSQDRDLGKSAVDLPQIAFGEIDVHRADVLLQAFNLAAARNRHDPWLLRQQPGERDLRRRRLFLLSDAGQQVDHGL